MPDWSIAVVVVVRWLTYQCNPLGHQVDTIYLSQSPIVSLCTPPDYITRSFTDVGVMGEVGWHQGGIGEGLGVRMGVCVCVGGGGAA